MRPRSLGSTGRYGTAQVSFVDRDTGSVRVGLHRLEALLDGVLVRAAERGVDEIARLWVRSCTVSWLQYSDGALDLRRVAEVDLRVDALGEQVDAQRDQVDVAGALAVAEQAALDAVGAG